MRRRMVATLLIAVLVIGILPVSVLAVGSESITYTSEEMAEEAYPASIVRDGNQWTPANESMQAKVSFANGSITLDSLYNKQAGKEYLVGSGENSLFTYGLTEELSEVGDTEEADFVRLDYGNPELKYYGSGWIDVGPKPTGGDGDYFTVTFYGTAVEYHATKAYNRGITDVYLDGVLVASVDMYSDIIDEPAVVYANYGLPQGAHTLKAVNRHNGLGREYMNVAYIRYADFATSTFWGGPASETAVQIDNGQFTRDVGSTVVPGAPSNSYGGGQTYFLKEGEGAEYTFNVAEGTTVVARLTGTKAFNRGIANFYVDGELKAQEDMYCTGEENYPAVLFDSGILTAGEHTIRFECSGKGNPQMQGGTPHTPLDAMTLLVTKPDGEATTVTKKGTWNRAASNTADFVTTEKDAEFSVPFKGDCIQWFGTTSANGGTADVYVDDVKVATVNLASETTVEKMLFQKTVWSPGIIPYGS